MPKQTGPVSNNGCPFPKLTQEEFQKIDAFAQPILFDLGEWDLKPEGKQILNNIVLIMKSFPNEKFIITGHTDNLDTRNFNSDFMRR